MHELTLLSPHRDDIIFSLHVCLSKWVRAGFKLTVLNFFTESAYAPHAISGRNGSVSGLRAVEDKHAFYAIDPEIELCTAGLRDAPLRLNIKSDDVCRPEARAYGTSPDLQSLHKAIRRHIKTGLAIAPLSLGGHVDHLLVRTAALLSIPRYNLGFYEDLPYATWTSESSLRESVTECEEQTRVPLKSVVVRGPNAVWRKRKAAMHYGSQATPEEAASIACFAARYGGGERIWVPAHGRRWTRFTRVYA